MFAIKNKNIITVAILALFMLVLITPLVADAQDRRGDGETAQGNYEVSKPGLVQCATNVADCLVFYVTYFLNETFSLFINWAAFSVSVFLAFNQGVTESPAVTSGFGATLAVANLGFVLGIIVIAIATILRRQSYGIKQLLWKLVIAAIVVNFSLVIAGTVLDLSESFSNYFLQAFNWEDNNGFVNAVTNAFAPQAMKEPPAPSVYTQCIAEVNSKYSSGQISWLGMQLRLQACNGKALASISADSLLKDADDFVKGIMNLVFSIVFNFIILLTLGALAVMLMIRYVVISILLILAPLAWLMWIFPNLSYLFKKWWNGFIRWAFFPPLMLFFLGLSLSVLTGANSPDGYISKAADAKSIAEGVSAVIEGSFLGAATQQIIIIGLALGGLIAANSIGIKFADVAIGLATGAGKYAAGAVWKGTKGAGTNLGERARTAGMRTEKTGSGKYETTTALQRAASKLQGIPLLGALGKKAAKITAPEQPKRVEEINKHAEENLKSLDERGLIADATSATAFVNPVHAAAMAQELARRDLTNDPRIQPLMDRFIGVAEKMGNMQAILNNRPELVRANPGETMEQAIARAIRGIRPGNAEQIAHQSIGTWNSAAAPITNEQMSVALNISNPQLGRLGQEGSTQQTEALRNTIRQISDQFSAGTLTLTPERQEQLNRVLKYTTESIHWQDIT